MFVMNSTALWLFLTVGILNMHHKNPTKLPPSWLEALAVNVLAKILCMCGTVALNAAERNQQRNGDVITLNEEGKATSPSDETVRISWIKLARIFDRFYLVLFGIMDVVAVVVFLCFYPSTTGLKNPQDFPKEPEHWDLKDF